MYSVVKHVLHDQWHQGGSRCFAPEANCSSIVFVSPDCCHNLWVLQESPRLEAAVQLHGGMICSSSQRDAGDRSYVLIITDMQREDLGSVPPNVPNLHITTVDHILVSPTCYAFRACILCLIAHVCINVIVPLSMHVVRPHNLIT